MYDGETAERQMLCRFFIYQMLYYNKENTIKRTSKHCLCFISTFLSEKQAFSGLHIHGKPGLGIVQGAVGQDGAAVGQWF